MKELASMVRENQNTKREIQGKVAALNNMMSKLTARKTMDALSKLVQARNTQLK